MVANQSPFASNRAWRRRYQTALLGSKVKNEPQSSERALSYTTTLFKVAAAAIQAVCAEGGTAKATADALASSAGGVLLAWLCAA